MLKRGEIMPRQYQLSDFYYAFDEDKWISRKEPRRSTFYRINYPDPIEKVSYLKEFLIGEPEAIILIYASSNCLFMAVK